MSRMLHLGVGNFFRAHQAWYTHIAGGWRITGVSLRRPDMRDALRDQDWSYGLKISDAAACTYMEIDLLDEILVAPEDPARVIAAIADPQIELITLTITEKGYLLGGDGALDLDAPQIRADLAGQTPVTAIGFLARGLAARAESGAALSIMSCDNLEGNGAKLGAAIRDFAGLAGLRIAGFLDDHVTFPSSMVDRITPALGDGLEAEMAAQGLPHRAPVATEAFSEWIIEDRFAGARPHWEGAGAVLTCDVGPFELRKLRMLNGAHSALAYSGINAGLRYVHEAIADPVAGSLALAVMEEAAEILPQSIRNSATEYRAGLLDRFANPALAHQLRQIAMDGSLKLPIRILSTLQDRSARGLESPACHAVITAYEAFLRGEIASGRPIEDPRAKALMRHLSGADGVMSLLSYSV